MPTPLSAPPIASALTDGPRILVVDEDDRLFIQQTFANSGRHSQLSCSTDGEDYRSLMDSLYQHYL